MTDEEKKARALELLSWFDKFEDLPPCKFCGRVMLAGYCCQEAREYWSKHKDDGCTE